MENIIILAACTLFVIMLFNAGIRLITTAIKLLFSPGGLILAALAGIIVTFGPVA